MFDTYCTMNLQTFWALTIQITIHKFINLSMLTLYTFPPLKDHGGPQASM